MPRSRRTRKGNRSSEEHPVGCGCRSCTTRLQFDFYSPGAELDDPDSMEDEEQPYWWNRNRRPET